MSGKTPLGAAFGRLRCLPNQVIATPSLAPTSDIHRTARRQASRASEITDLFGGRPARGLVDRLLRDLRWMSTLPAAIPWPLSRWLRRGPRPKPEASTIPARCGAGLRPTRFHTAWRCDCDPRARRDCLSCRCPLRVASRLVSESRRSLTPPQQELVRQFFTHLSTTSPGTRAS